VRWITIGAYRKPQPLWDKLSPDVKDLIEKLMAVDPSLRLDPIQALEHPWLKSIVAEAAK
jgi:serine/threonine protein kinase